ncbi:adhesion G-protein coupled receptor G7-like [Amphiura filiformis]|uniref:adhesion G-protein coupled receptor G7-like n=1 Tax=Amphiura filiformis TaxID=82378 RepID=UPI003B220246
MQASIALDVNTEITVVDSNVAVSGVVLDNESSMLGGIGFGIQSSLQESFANNSTKTYRMRDTILNDSPDAYIYVPQLMNENESNKLKFVFIAYKNDFLFPSNTTTIDNFSVGGVIISASVEGVNGTGSIQFEEPVVFENALDPNITTDRNTSSNERDSCYQSELEDPRCVFWDFELADGNGDWSEDGCRYMGDNEGRTVCHCDHLTNFAVLVFHGKKPILSKALDIFSTVGCAVSIASLVVTVIVFLIFKTLRKRSRVILIQLCASLILLYITFIVGIDRTCPRLPCRIIAIILHYAVLASVAWMVVEARFLYIKLVRVFEAESQNFVIKYSVAAWVIPLVIVGVSVGVSFALDLRYYQNPHYCFVMPGPIVYYALLLPIGLALVFNLVTFVTITRSISRQRPGHSRKTSDHRALITRLRNIIAISTVLGLTWVFGFLAIDKATFAFQILFCVFNSLQGVFIFILFCVMQPDVKQAVSSFCAKPRHDRQRDPHTSGASSSREAPVQLTSASGVTTTDAPSEMYSNEGFELTEPMYDTVAD